MMMPANFSAVNAEVVYGGAVADYLPNAWTAANVKQQLHRYAAECYSGHHVQRQLGR